MDKLSIDRAAAILVKARRSMEPLTGLPDALKPRTITEAHAIQDAVTSQLGKLIGGFKAMKPANDEPTRGVIYGGTLFPSPASIPAVSVPQCGVEGEVAFVFHRDLPARATPYSRNEVAAVVDACAAIEVVHSRYAAGAPVTNLEKLADSISNGAFVYDLPHAAWRDLPLGKLHVTLTVNGETVLDQDGGHPTGDPLGVAVVLANLWREKGGVRAGQFVTCGSFTGLKFLQPGDVCGVRFEGLGAAEVTFAPSLRRNAPPHGGTATEEAEMVGASTAEMVGGSTAEMVGGSTSARGRSRSVKPRG
jgi:2-keto-4-pentenoate hydratase